MSRKISFRRNPRVVGSETELKHDESCMAAALRWSLVEKLIIAGVKKMQWRRHPSAAMACYIVRSELIANYVELTIKDIIFLAKLVTGETLPPKFAQLCKTRCATVLILLTDLAHLPFARTFPQSYLLLFSFFLVISCRRKCSKQC